MSNIELYEAVDNGFPSKPLSNPEPGTFPIRYIFARAPRKSIGAFAAHPSLKKLTKIIFQKGPGYEQTECASRRRATSDAPQQHRTGDRGFAEDLQLLYRLIYRFDRSYISCNSRFYMSLYKRKRILPQAGTETFFLWGARQAGKSSLLREAYADAVWVDLLKADVFRRYTTRPEILREELERLENPFVVVDEVQRVPALLDEIHWLHENRGIQFALCGSSARKLKRGHGNLLGGRAIRLELYGLCALELGDDFDLQKIISHGTLPRIYQSAQPQRLLNAYVGEYLKEEIMAEGLVRNLPPFSEFLNCAALGDTEQINYTNIARELGVARDSVRGYYQILSDTLLATLLPVYRKRPKRRLSIADKFYFHDVGVVNFLAKRGKPEPGSDAYGKAFENWVFHELRCYNQYQERYAQFSFWRLSTGVEVDFIVNDLECAIECKSSERVHDHHLKGLRELKKEHPKCGRRLLVSREAVSRKTADGIEILSIKDFLQELWDGRLFR